MKFEIAPKSTEIVSNWDDARFYCFSLSIDGKSGWRLPTKKELNTMVDCLNGNDYYWTSEEWGHVSVWVQKDVAYRGIYHQFQAHRESKNRVRAVRSKI
jgi:hypothetical protein